MNFTCPYCGSGAFTVFFDIAGSQIATCNKCGNRMPFDQEHMAPSQTARAQNRTLRTSGNGTLRPKTTRTPTKGT